MTDLWRDPRRPLLVVDLRATTIETCAELWSHLKDRLEIPTWIGSNLDAWNDVLLGGGMSATVDGHSVAVRLSATGLFGPGAEGHEFVSLSNESDHFVVLVAAEDAPTA